MKHIFTQELCILIFLSLIFSSLNAKETTESLSSVNVGKSTLSSFPPTSEAYDIQSDYIDFNKLSDFLPPAPSSYSFSRYGGVNLGLSSGTISQTIPVSGYSTGKLSLPISINYASSGFKIDELGSEVGMGWSLIAGGVITRTVYGKADEKTSRVEPTSSTFHDYEDMLDFMNAITGGGDGQPDIFNFSFNGYAGQFILSQPDLGTSFGKPVLLNNSGILIESVGFSGFVITTPDGVKYEFLLSGTSNNFTNAECAPKIYDSSFMPVTTSWYLTKITHPDNDVISLEYSDLFYVDEILGLSQTVKKSNGGILSCLGGYEGYGTDEVNWCYNRISFGKRVLERITSTNGGDLIFNYSGINLGNSYSDSLLVSIEKVKPFDSDPYKEIMFDYDIVQETTSNGHLYISNWITNRAFLESLTERSLPAENVNKVYSFNYNDINSIPGRLSLTQDHWGYYNGKTNFSLVTDPGMAELRTWFDNYDQDNDNSNDYADREPDPVYAQKGLLNSITYPTGGVDEIFYEGNTLYKPVTITNNETLHIEGYIESGVYNFSDSLGFIVDFYQSVELEANSFLEGQGGGSVSVKIMRDGNYVPNTSIVLGPDDLGALDFRLDPGIYSLLLEVEGIVTDGGNDIEEKLSGDVTLNYMSGGNVVSANVATGGVRVEKVISYDPVSGKSNTKKYYYGQVESLDVSSAHAMYEPTYYHRGIAYYFCPDAACASVIDEIHTLYSNSTNNLYVYSNSPITYSHVVESFGDNFESGGIEHEFLVASDIEGANYMSIYDGEYHEYIDGNEIIGCPYTSFSYKNAKEIYSQTFKVEGIERITLKEVKTNYHLDDDTDVLFDVYVGNKKFELSTSYYNTDLGLFITAFDLYRYRILKKWVYVDSVETITYDSDGLHRISEVISYDYENPEHAQPSKITTYDSRGAEITVENLYSADATELNLSGNEELARASLESNHIYTPVLDQKVSRSDSVLYQYSNEYRIDSITGLASLSKKESKVSGVVASITYFNKYNDKGNLLEQQKKDDIKYSYSWGYNNRYPVLVAENVSSETLETSIAAACSSFDNLDSLLFSLSAADDPIWRSFNTNLRNDPDLSGAFITTYTYDPGIGMTSETDPNGTTIYYEYDDFGRLKIKRKEAGDIIEAYEYGYKNQ